MAHATTTPAYVTDEIILERDLRAIRGIADEAGCALLYSPKANAVSDVLLKIADYVDGFGCSSLFELKLIDRVCGFWGTANEIWIAFDGARETEPDARKLRTAAGVPVYLAFSPSADDWLVGRVRGSAEPQRIAVVTRDQRVGGRARHRGASVVAPAQFLTLCGEA